MKKRNWSVLLFALAFLTYFFPTWNGLFFGTSQDITLGDGRTQAAIFLVGGLLLWYQEGGEINYIALLCYFFILATSHSPPNSGSNIVQ